jgi:hypothetical protein
MGMEWKTLPVPRLELYWQQEDEPSHWLCRYRLVLPCRDIRKITQDIEQTIVEMGETRRTADREPLKYGVVETPFRDGVHCRRDAAILHLPAYAVYGTYATLLEPIEDAQ